MGIFSIAGARSPEDWFTETKVNFLDSSLPSRRVKQEPIKASVLSRTPAGAFHVAYIEKIPEASLLIAVAVWFGRCCF